MKEKYTVDKCSLTAKLMREGGGIGEKNEEDEDEMVDSEEEK
jgi:hypothetical protein